MVMAIATLAGVVVAVTAMLGVIEAPADLSAASRLAW
jgi:hypothetical protein